MSDLKAKILTELSRDENSIMRIHYHATDLLEDLLEGIEKLEQQLSNSISKDRLSGLVDSYEERMYKAKFSDDRDYAAEVLVGELNKLIEGDNDEEI